MKKGDEEKAGAVEQECLPLGPPPPPPQSPPPPQLLPSAKEATQLPLEQIELRGSQQKAKIGGNVWFFHWIDKVSDCGDGAKEDRIAIWDKKNGVEHQLSNSWSWRSHELKGCSSSHSYLVLPPQTHSHPHRRRYRRSRRSKHSGCRTSSTLSYLVLPPRTRGQPQCQQILMRATASGRLVGLFFLFFVLGGQSNRGQDGSDWKREGIGTGWSFSIFWGWGHETPGRRLTRLRRTRVRKKE